jgi:hypothetical protein
MAVHGPTALSSLEPPSSFVIGECGVFAVAQEKPSSGIYVPSCPYPAYQYFHTEVNDGYKNHTNAWHNVEAGCMHSNFGNVSECSTLVDAPSSMNWTSSSESLHDDYQSSAKNIDYPLDFDTKMMPDIAPADRRRRAPFKRAGTPFPDCASRSFEIVHRTPRRSPRHRSSRRASPLESSSQDKTSSYNASGPGSGARHSDQCRVAFKIPEDIPTRRFDTRRMLFELDHISQDGGITTALRPRSSRRRAKVNSIPSSTAFGSNSSSSSSFDTPGQGPHAPGELASGHGVTIRASLPPRPAQGEAAQLTQRGVRRAALAARKLQTASHRDRSRSSSHANAFPSWV